MKVASGNSTIKFNNQLLPIEGFIGIHDLPNVSIIYIEKDRVKFALVSMEIVMLWDDFLNRCRQAVSNVLQVPIENVWLHMTHAITTPHAPGGPMIGLGGQEIKLSEAEKDQRNAELKKRKLYEDTIFIALIDALKQCLKPKEAKLYIGASECDLIQGRDIKTKDGWWIGVGGDGKSNQTMTILSFKDENDNCIAHVISYAMKPCVIDNAEMDKGTRLVSADAPGLLCRKLEEKYNCPALYLTAAAGDRVPIKTAWFDTVGDDGKIKTVDYGVKKGLEFAKELSQKMFNSTVDIIGQSLQVTEDNLVINHADFEWKSKGRIKMKPYNFLAFESDGSKQVPVDVVIIGDVAFVGGKPEINTNTESALKDISDYEHTLYVSMLNGGMKYMPDKQSYDEYRWEALASMLMPGAAEKFVEIAGEYLKR